MANNSRNALILGSNPGLRDTVKANLKGLGFELLKSTSSGAAALEELSYEDSSCGIIICELNLEDMTCRKFLEEVRSMPDFDQTMIILLAGQDEVEKLEACLDLGIGGIIKKPFNTDAFKDLLQIPYSRLKSLNGNFKALFLSTLASFSESVSRYKTAIKYQQDILKLADSAVTHFDLGRLYLLTKNKEEAQHHFKRSVEIEPGFQARIDKLLEILKISLKDSGQEVIPKEALKIFPQPLKAFSNSYYNASTLKKVMIIGGTHSDRVGFKNSLGHTGNKNVQLQEDPVQALKILRDSDIDLVICWMDLGSSDAANLTKVLRGIYRPAELKIMVILNEQQLPFLSKVMEEGADGYLVLPFTPDRFCQRLHRCMVLHDLCALTGPSMPLTKAAFAMFDCEKYSEGKTLAEQAMTRNPKDAVAHLFLAMNLHMMGHRDLAYIAYDLNSKNYPPLAGLCQIFRAELDKIAPPQIKKEEPKKKKPVKSAAAAAAVEETDDVEVESEAEESTAAPKKRKKRVAGRSDSPLVDTRIEEDLTLERSKLQAKAQHADDDAAPAADDHAEEVAEQDEEAAPRVPRVKRIRNEVPQEKLGNFSSIEDLQMEIFGKVEAAIEHQLIPQSLLDLGVSQANFVQPAGLEQIFGGTHRADGGTGRIIQLEDTIVPWMPTESISEMAFDAVQNRGLREVSGGSPQAFAEPGKQNAQDVALFAGQAQLLNSRVICLPSQYQGTENFHDYLQAIGKVVSDHDLMTNLGIVQDLDDATHQTLLEAQKDPDDEAKKLKLGEAIVVGGYADDLFSRLSVAENTEATETEDTGNRLNYQLINEAIEEIKEPFIRFHQECLDGKKEFENTLPYIMESIAQGKVDFQMLYKAMEQDHNSLESFKKIYVALSKAKRQDALDKLFKEKHKDYLKNRKSRRALNRFLLAMGDRGRARIVAIKSIKEDRADPDSLKTMALMCFQEGDLKNAQICCEKMIAQKAYLEYSYNLLGIIHKKLNRLEEAIGYYKKGIEAEPESAKLYHNIAIAYSLMGDTNKSKRAQERAKKLKKLQGI